MGCCMAWWIVDGGDGMGRDDSRPAWSAAPGPGGYLMRSSPGPNPMRIAKLGVVGAGTMGSGIAALAASAGIPVVLLDIAGRDGDRNGPAKAGLERARKARPAAFMDPARAALIAVGNLDDSLALLSDCDLVIEAIIEQPAPKQALYARLEPLLKPATIVASNGPNWEPI